MKKLFYLLCSGLVMMTSCTSCEGGNEDPPAPVTPLRHLLVQDKPFLMLGAQLRTDFFLALDGRTPEELDPYFELAAGMNLMVVQVPVSWRDVEPKKDQYTGSLVEKLIELSERHGLKLELLWFGSYMCGYSVEGYIPDYVVNATATYPELKPSADFNGWLGKHYYLKPNTPALVDREKKAIAHMMTVIDNYDKAGGGKHTVIGIQVENEPDMLATRHNAAHGYSPEQLWPDLIDMLDQLGQVVKNSSYDCYTRVNLTTTYDNYLRKSSSIVATKGIDYVGLDPYENTISGIEAKLNGLRWIDGNYAHIAENGGEYANNDILMLKAVTMGCGYEIFEVVTTPHEYLVDWTLRGVYNPDFTPKPHTQQIVDAFKIFKGAWVDIAEAPVKDIVGFNISQNDGAQTLGEKKSASNASISWNTVSRGVAFAVECSGYITAASTKADNMTFGNVTVTGAEKGHYGMDRKWVAEGAVTLTDNRLTMEPGAVYRIKIQN